MIERYDVALSAEPAQVRNGALRRRLTNALTEAFNHEFHLETTGQELEPDDTIPPPWADEADYEHILQRSAT